MTAHTTKISTAQEAGRRRVCTALETGPLTSPALPKKGNAAMATMVENHTAKRVLEFCRVSACSTAQPKAASTMPSIMPLSIRSAKS